MEVYQFLRGSLAWTVTVAGLWPLNIPLAVLAYRIRLGPQPITMPRKELWWRATFAALIVALITVAMVLVDYYLAENIGFPAGPVHLIVFMSYVPAVVWVFFVFFALEDFFQGLNLFVIYVYLPVLVLFLLNAVVPFWEPFLIVARDWLKEPT